MTADKAGNWLFGLFGQERETIYFSYRKMHYIEVQL